MNTTKPKQRFIFPLAHNHENIYFILWEQGSVQIKKNEPGGFCSKNVSFLIIPLC